MSSFFVWRNRHSASFGRGGFAGRRRRTGVCYQSVDLSFVKRPIQKSAVQKRGVREVTTVAFGAAWVAACPLHPCKACFFFLVGGCGSFDCGYGAILYDRAGVRARPHALDGRIDATTKMGGRLLEPEFVIGRNCSQSKFIFSSRFNLSSYATMEFAKILAVGGSAGDVTWQIVRRKSEGLKGGGVKGVFSHALHDLVREEGMKVVDFSHGQDVEVV